jgi:uncharacterized protein (TIGR00730 family)
MTDQGSTEDEGVDGDPGGPREIDHGELYDRIDDAVLDLWKVVDDLAGIPVPTQYYRVTVFGSSRIREGDELYEEVRELARELSSRGCDIVTGGGPGLMAAANEGQSLGDPEGRTRSYGLNVELPHEQGSNPFVEQAYTHRTFFTRLHHFVRLSSAFVVVPGGIGTTLEAMMVWQLCQVRKVEDRPLVFLGEMWRELVVWARRHMVEVADQRRLADAEDMEIPRCVDTVDEVVAAVEEDLERFHRGR